MSATSTSVSSRGRRRRSVLVLAVVISVVVGGEWWLPSAPSVTVTAVTQAPISSVALVCASSPTFPANTQVLVSAADVTALTSAVFPASEEPGSITVTALQSQTDQGSAPRLRLPAPLTEPGSQVRIATRQGSAPLLVRGSGSLAPVVVAAGTSVVTRGDDRGMATATCRRPATSWWFSGAASTLGRLTRIVLTNADELPASVSITIHSDEGLVAAPAARGLVVPPQTQMELRLDVVAPGLSSAALRVRATTGRIHVGVLTREVEITTPRGVEWLTPMSASSDLLIPVPSRLSSAELTLLSPERDATAAVWVRDAESRFLPPGFERVELPAGQLVTLAVDDLIVGGATLDIAASSAVVGSVSARVEPVRGVRGDVVSIGAAPALSQAALMTGLRTQDRHTLALSGVDGPSTVRVSVLAAGVDPIVETMELAAATSVVRDLVLPDRVGFATVLVEPVGASPTSGRIVASMVTTTRMTDGVAGAGRVFVARQNSVAIPVVVPAVGMR